LLIDFLLNIRAISPKKVLNYFGWIEWVMMGLKPFSFVKNTLTRKYSNLEGISAEIAMLYVNILVNKVEDLIRDSVPSKFTLLFYG
jgi:hypothetical protein